MTITTCPECGENVTDTMEKCPTCGFPLMEKEELPADYFDFISVTAETVDAALEKATEILKENAENVEYEVVQREKKTLFSKKSAIIHARRIRGNE